MIGRCFFVLSWEYVYKARENRKAKTVDLFILFYLEVLKFYFMQADFLLRSTGRPGHKQAGGRPVCAFVAQNISRKEAQGRNVHFLRVSNLTSISALLHLLKRSWW